MEAGEYAKMRALEDRYWWFVGRRALARSLVRLAVAPTEKPDLLDLGCGPGALLSEVAGETNSTGADFSALALEFCRERGIARLACADAQAMPFAARSFDVVTALDILEHVEDDDAAFDEIFRVLRPGGALVISVPAFRWLWGPHDMALHHFRRYTRHQVEERLRDAGFTVERLSYAVFLLFPFVIVSRIVEKFRKGPAKASLPAVPDWTNAFLIRLLSLESRLVASGVRLPWGSSVVALARKPGA
ncbi:class I SAM-dependent methyltransferase [soil metagenome]